MAKFDAILITGTLFILFHVVHGQISMSELLTSGTAEEIANKTYVQEQSELQKKIFKGYDRKIRPVQNQSQTIQVSMHVYLMHFSVDQVQQVITLNGHIYMTWIDYNAVWDPVQFNNIRITMAKQWELWTPELRVANSVSGVNQYFEISKRSHATLTSVTPNKTKIEIYPTFAIQMGCDFDYSDYPFDVQKCALRLYTTSVMAQVDLLIFYNLQPSVMLGWGDQSSKKHIRSNMSYYRNRQYTPTRPTTAYETHGTWSVVLVWVEIKRNASLFWVSLATPAVKCFWVSMLINLFSFLMTKPEHSVLAIILNFFIQSLFTRDAIRALPPAVGESPRIVKHSNALLFLTTLTLGLHLCSVKFRNRPVVILKRITSISPLRWALTYIAFKPSDGSAEEDSDDTIVDAMGLFRHSCFLVFLLINIYLFLYLV